MDMMNKAKVLTSGDCNFPKSQLPVSMHIGQNTDYKVVLLQNCSAKC